MVGPVVIIGMHRSGTSLLARTLESCGLYLGWHQQAAHGEAVFFQRLNDWILRQAGGTWDAPAPLTLLDADRRLHPLIVDYLRLSVSSPRAASFLGPLGYLRDRSLIRIGGTWGWKDPRTTLTLDLWREVFPDLRIVHVLRHGVDVANSLAVRYEKMIDIAEARYQHLRWTYRFRSRSSTFADTPRVSDLDQAFRLWELYSEAGRSHVRALGDRALELRYEDLLADPAHHLGRLANFAGLDPGRAEGLSTDFDAERSQAFRSSRELSEFAERMAGRLRHHGY